MSETLNTAGCPRCGAVPPALWMSIVPWRCGCADQGSITSTGTGIVWTDAEVAEIQARAEQYREFFEDPPDTYIAAPAGTPPPTHGGGRAYLPDEPPLWFAALLLATWPARAAWGVVRWWAETFPGR